MHSEPKQKPLQKTSKCFETLASRGLNLQAVIPLADLPNSIPIDPAWKETFTSLVLLGHGGQRLWRHCSKEGKDPIDTYTIRCVNEHWIDLHPEGVHEIVYPSLHHQVPLLQLGEYLQMGKISPLGQHIHPKYGLWFAYRCVWLTSLNLEPKVSQEWPLPCETCVEKPCMKTCPSGAVRGLQANFDINACTQYRKKMNSSCQNTCHARLACPIGAQHRYVQDQVRYHYQKSLATIMVFDSLNSD